MNDQQFDLLMERLTIITHLLQEILQQSEPTYLETGLMP